jgi:L-threonylcarbamoyladenylate synthase
MQITQQANDLIQPFKQGKVFAYPTEAVYGLGCDPDNQSAVMHLLEIKKRSPAKGLILIASNFSQVEKYLKPLSESQQQFTQASDTTYIFPALKSAPVWLTGDFDSLAIRITKHPLPKALSETQGSAVESTSANISGQQAAKTVEELTTQLGDKIDYLLEGELGGSQKPSVIRDSVTGKVIRK